MYRNNPACPDEKGIDGYVFLKKALKGKEERNV